MKVSLCTITFRHQLISFSDIVRFAHHFGFDGIELWGIHALNLFHYHRDETIESLRYMSTHGMKVSMISDYLDIAAEADFQQTLEKCRGLIQASKWFGAKQIRTFAGQKGSAEISTDERSQYVQRLYELCELCKKHDVDLLIETHPGTLTDRIDSTLSLLQEVNHSHLKVNLDFLHVWESGTDPVDGYYLLKPWVQNYHLKNISSSDYLHVFQPHNVYSASGSRQGMVSLWEGAVDFLPILEQIEETDHYASIEWFGSNALQMLKEEIEWLKEQRLRPFAIGSNK
ncbi:sugar phosphate isomerase/epimerase family protein [Caldalkalibacillus mannanilyticus]|uniref:sugar phosphate isomerase/epimerase family protein n=1 Tax=Caldalkalibacillus mannanilyticus TaxID=1418 RepID=UPI000468F148|nr:sugar phosphate isomerase/epimerase family protein [Caldalkalibacillus mannanilyticus]